MLNLKPYLSISDDFCSICTVEGMALMAIILTLASAVTLKDDTRQAFLEPWTQDQTGISFDS